MFSLHSGLGEAYVQLHTEGNGLGAAVLVRWPRSERNSTRICVRGLCAAERFTCVHPARIHCNGRAICERWLLCALRGADAEQ